jgi:hypothetical protein
MVRIAHHLRVSIAITRVLAVAIKQAIEPFLKAEGKARQAAAGPAAARGKKAIGGAKLAPAVKGKTRDKVAKRAGKKRTTFAKAEHLQMGPVLRNGSLQKNSRQKMRVPRKVSPEIRPPENAGPFGRRGIKIKESRF